MNNENMNNNQFDPNMQQNNFNPNMGQPNQFVPNQDMNMNNNQFNPNMQQNNPQINPNMGNQFNPNMGPTNQFNPNPNMVTNDPNQNGKKPMDTKTIVIIAVVIVAILVAAYFLFIKKDDNISDGGKGGSTGSGTVKEQVKLEENITVSEYGQYSDNYGKYIVFKIDNNNSTAVNIGLDVNFYDATGAAVDAGYESSECVSKGVPTYLIIETDKDFASYKYSVKADSDLYNCVESKDVSLKVTPGEKEYIIQYNNNSSYPSVSYGGYLAMYKDDKLINCKFLYESDIRSGIEKVSKESYPYNNNYKQIVPDRYEILFTDVTGKE